MRLERSWIERHIPHQGTMCLLDCVVQWDSQRIVCLGSSHRDPANPLRSEGRLGIACGIEYASQAMAVHGSLVSPAGPDRPATVGYLAGLRGVRPSVRRLDDVRADLRCAAERIAGDDASALYDFELSADGVALLSGRATVLFAGGDRAES